MTPILSRLTDLIPFERKKKPMRAHVPLYTNWGIGVDGWLWSSILRNRNLPDDRVGYAMAYLLVPEIRTCVDIYVDQIERIAWAIQENPGWDAKNDREIARSTDKKDRHPFQRAMTRHRRDLSIGFLRRLAYMMLLFDEVYVLPEVNDYGLVSDLTVLNNLAIQPQVQSGYLQWIDYFSSGGGAVKYRPNELAIDHGFNPMDDFRGSSLVMTAIDSINVLRNLVAYLNEFFVNNARMGLVGSTSEPLSAEQLKQLRETIADFLKGKGNQFRTFISPVPVDWTVFENPDIEKQFNIDAPMVEKIFRAFRVPLALAGDLQGTRYKESADVDAIFIKRSVAPILKNVQEFVNDSLLPYFVEHSAGGQIDQRFEFDLSEFDSLTDGDKLQNDIVNQNVTAGLIPIAHAQELAGYEPDDALKEYYMLQGIPVPKLVYLNYYKKQFGVDETGNIPQEPQEPLSVGGKLLPRPALPGVNGKGEKPSLPAGEPIVESSFGEHRFVSDKQRRFFFAMFGDMVDDVEWGGSTDRPYSNNAPGEYTDYGNGKEIQGIFGNSEAKKKSRKLAKDHAKGLNKDEKAAIKDYTTKGFFGLNAELRDDAPLSERSQKIATGLDSAISKRELPENTILYRGATLSKEQADQFQPGARVVDKGFTSTSLSQDFAENWDQGLLGGNHEVVMRIKAPKGTHAMSLEEVTSAGKKPPLDNEILLPRGTNFLVTKVTVKENTRYVDLKILDPEKFDNDSE